MKRSFRPLAAIVAAAALLLSACGSQDDTQASGTSGGDFKVAIAYDLGGRGDGGFNDLAYAGAARAAEELDAEVVEATARSEDTDADRTDRLKLMAEGGADAVIAVGFLYATALTEVAPQYPETWFAIVDDDTVTGANVASLMFSANEGSFLVGAAAALETETGKVGYIGGVNTPLLQEFEAGFTAGAKTADPGVEVISTYLTEPPNFDGFNDPQRGAESANGMFDSDVDIIFAAAGGSGQGVIESAHKAGKSAIGVDNDQYASVEAPFNEVIITSMLKKVDVGVHGFITSVSDNSAEPGTSLYDLAADGVGFSTSGDKLSADTIAKLDELAAQIKDGSITVPTTPES